MQQLGVVTIEYALLLILAIIPLLLFTFSSTLLFAAKQTLSTAAAEGSRAALRHGTAQQKQLYACSAAKISMQWLINFSRANVNCSVPSSPPITVSSPYSCGNGLPSLCMSVTTSFDIEQHPFIPGTAALYGWVLGGPLTSHAVVQLDSSFTP